MCGGVFFKEVSEENALIDLHEQFGEDVSIKECDIVCDNCWKKVRPDIPQNKEVFDNWQIKRNLNND